MFIPWPQMHLKLDERRLTQLDPEDRLLKLTEAAELCSISVQTLRSMIDRGEIRVVELGDKNDRPIEKSYLTRGEKSKPAAMSLSYSRGHAMAKNWPAERSMSCVN